MIGNLQIYKANTLEVKVINNKITSAKAKPRIKFQDQWQNNAIFNLSKEYSLPLLYCRVQQLQIVIPVLEAKLFWAQCTFMPWAGQSAYNYS